MVKNQPTKKEIEVTLENCFNGEFVRVPHTKKIICKTCKGEGGKNIINCYKCKGVGTIEQVVQIGLGLCTSQKSVCPNCYGKGKSINESDKCRDCRGEKMKTINTILDVPIEKSTYENA